MKTYSDIEGWFCFQPFYLRMASEYFQNGMVALEMGVFKGKSICFLANEIKKRSLSMKLYGIDRWASYQEYDEFLKNAKDCGVSEFIEPIRATSEVASKLFSDDTFDFLFIDGSHEYEDVKADLGFWYPKLKGGGIIAGDDYDPAHPGVIQAVDERFDAEAKKQWPVWYVRKP
jgi:predicted O-methyltransferase YrrM